MAAYADNNLASLYLSLARLSDARASFQSALDIRRSVLGERDKLTVATLHNLATTLISEGHFADGEEKIREVILARSELLGAQDPLTLSSVSILGYCFIQELRFAEADQLFTSLLKTYRAANLTRRDGYLASLNNLAFVRLRQGSYKDASDLLGELAAAEAQKSGTRSLTYSVALTNLGRAQYLAKDYEAAKTTLEQAFVIQSSERGVFQKYAAISRDNLGLVLLVNRDADSALAAFREALALARDVFDPRNQFFSLVHHNISVALARKGEVSAALEEARKAISFIPADNASQVLDIEAGFGMSANTYDDLYSDFISISKRALEKDNSTDTGLVREAFRASQLASASRSSAALFLMSARFASDESAVGKLIRKRQDLIGEWHALNRQIISGFSRVAAKTDLVAEREQAEKLSLLQAQINNIEGEIAAVHPKFAELFTPRPLELAEAQALLGENEVLVNVHIGTDETSCLVHDQECRSLEYGASRHCCDRRDGDDFALRTGRSGLAKRPGLLSMHASVGPRGAARQRPAAAVPFWNRPSALPRLVRTGGSPHQRQAVAGRAVGRFDRTAVPRPGQRGAQSRDRWQIRGLSHYRLARK